MLATALDIKPIRIAPSAPFARQSATNGADNGSARWHLLGATRTIAAREHVFCAGDARRHVYQLQSGLVRIYSVLADGRRQVVDFAFPGDLIGLEAGATYPFSAEAAAPSRLNCIPVATLTEHLRSDPGFAVELYERMSRGMNGTRDMLVTMGRRSALERVASFMVALARRNAAGGNPGGVIALPMTRSDIADFLGLTIETVSRTITRLRQMHLIRLRTCTEVEMLDLSGLIALADGSAS